MYSKYLELSSLLNHFCLILPQPNETPLQHNHPHDLYRFSFFVLTHSTTCHHKHYMYQTIFQTKPIKFIVMLYPDHHNLWVKHTTHQKAEFSEPILFQSQTTRSTTTLYSIQSMLNSKQNGRCSFIFITQLVHASTPTISTKNPLLNFSQFSSPYSFLTCSQDHLYKSH